MDVADELLGMELAEVEGKLLLDTPLLVEEELTRLLDGALLDGALLELG